ncbi:MAG: uroporphyrinogen-III C-methyltransferase [Actinomycetota bacterium]
MTVYLVGAGPGDPGLITVRGAEVLAKADVVIYDRLSVASLLDLAPPSAERISVGKAPGRASRPQADINALLVERGKAQDVVVRLKGGDPFVFARGGEEVAALQAAGVPFEIVPGITSAVAVPAYAGVPVTHRGLASTFTVVTGQEGEAGVPVDWEAVARLGGTIAVLMGVAKREEIARRLMAGGLGADTPVAAITWGTRPEQHTCRTTLGRLAGEEIESPAVMLIGAVAALDLPWYENRPLFGKRIIVTRAREQASGLVERLHELGAATVELPVIEIAEPADGGAGLREAARRVSDYDWVTFTSANAVTRFFAALGDVGRDTRALAAARVAAIGPGTADALAAAGVRADLVPERFVAESLLEAFPDGPGRVLLPRAAVARDALPTGLTERGWTVDVVEAYRTVVGRPAPEALAAAATAHAITFTSSSTVTNYLTVAGDGPVPPVVACIGPITADTARSAGLTVDVVATEHTIEGLVQSLVERFQAGG